MPSYLDLALLLIVAVSALLSMVRGFTREILAIASWGAAAIAAYYLYPLVLPYVTPYIAKETVARIVAIAAVFFVTLIIVSIVTVKLSEAILDSKVGALDRTWASSSVPRAVSCSASWPFCSSTGWCRPASSRNGSPTAKSKPLLAGHRGRTRGHAARRPREHLPQGAEEGQDLAQRGCSGRYRKHRRSPDPTPPPRRAKTEAAPPVPACAPQQPDRRSRSQKLDKSGKSGKPADRKP